MNLQTVKRCTVGMVLAIAATMPGFQQLHTSVEGLKLIGFSVWERRGGSGRNVTFPARQYSVN